jgi:hypothetical protein
MSDSPSAGAALPDETSSALKIASSASTDKRRTILLALVALVFAAATAGAGWYFGNRHGYDVAYTSEHSHYLFERARANKMQASIGRQKACINHLAGALKPVTDTGLYALGEIMGTFGLMYWGTISCNRQSGFGFLTAAQVHRVLPSTNTQ